MTQSEYEAELHFRLCKSIFATLAIRGIIGEDCILRRTAAVGAVVQRPLCGLSSGRN